MKTMVDYKLRKNVYKKHISLDNVCVYYVFILASTGRLHPDLD